jgi:hypothetical protein
MRDASTCTSPLRVIREIPQNGEGMTYEWRSDVYLFNMSMMSRDSDSVHPSTETKCKNDTLLGRPGPVASRRVSSTGTVVVLWKLA